MRKNLIMISCFLLAIWACREPFDFSNAELGEPRVVIDGFLTDQAAAHKIRVSYTNRVSDVNEIENVPIEDATVIIEDDQGGFTSLSFTNGGLYETAPGYRAEEGRAYTVVVTLANGEEYRSLPRYLPQTSPATAQLEVKGAVKSLLTPNSVEEEEEGASIIATIDRDSERHFYQWLISYYFIFEADLTIYEANRFCYVKDTEIPKILLLQDNPVASGQASQLQYEIDFIPTDKRMKHEFGFEGRLLTMNESDYNFWESVKSLTENTGGLFDAAPYSLEGNITNTETGKPALGYFGVYRESMERIFFSQEDLGFISREFFPCALPPFPPRTRVESFRDTLSCEDCRLTTLQENYGTVRPEWWGN